MKHPTPLAIATLGGGLIAVTYGLARFMFGLILPSIRADIAMTSTLAGVIGALPFVSFVLAILAAPTVARTLGVRWAATVAAGFALAGLAAIANAPGPWVLAFGVLTCGISTGLSTPVMASAVNMTVRPALQGRVNAAINAGTSLGVAAAGPAVLWWADAWRPVYLAAAGLALLALLAAAAKLPGRAPRPTDRAAISQPRVSRRQWLDITRMSILAAAMGFVSALYWVFAPDFAVQAGGLSSAGTAWMWLAVGVGGLAGGAAGDLVQRHGHAISHAFALAVLAASLTLLAADPSNVVLGLVSAAAFGGAYMTLTGLYLVGGTQILAQRPAQGPVIPFLAIACGQIAGSPVGGWLISAHSYGAAFGAFAAVGLGIALLSLWLVEASAPKPWSAAYCEE
ncbi:Predicted arabinose efflux permease, MFS family [Limimonas halophila]|uniref:Predicted arabinose efflux permease, MFS family n=1 Tax=Limimonas halophila TaxID=1082479 RepID=A0A1G7L6Q9_9PROT|nr:MFS transporter [Limimonas halophila]SDF45056.1 Predicted arabinose efflux permease, MFS family [Limimonas halophila]